MNTKSINTGLHRVRVLAGLVIATGFILYLPCHHLRAAKPVVFINGADKETTSLNLLKAYGAETNASKKYAAFAWKANAEGYPEIALLFNAISNSEHVHALNYKALLLKSGMAVPEVKLRFKVGSTAENLEQAISGESQEVRTTYPEFMAAANHDGNRKALENFNHAYKAEIKHRKFFENALTALLMHTTRNLPGEYSVCQVCGNTYDSQAPVRCAICSSPREKFRLVKKQGL